MFGFFKKKKEEEKLHYDPTNITVRDIRIGWFLEYDDVEWQVIEEFEYDWGNEHFSFEYLLADEKNNKIYLSLEQDDELVCKIFRKLRFSRLKEADEIEDMVTTIGKPPRQLTVEGIPFYRETETPGYFRNTKQQKSVEFIVWEYVDDTEKQILNIEQWGDDEFEAAMGYIVPEYKFRHFVSAQTT